MPALNLCIDDWLAGGGVQDESFEPAVALLPGDDRQIANPTIGESDLIPGVGELRVVAADEEVETGLYILRRRDLFEPFLVILGLGQFDVPFVIGFLGDQCVAIALVNPFGTPDVAIEAGYPVGLHQTEISLGQVAIADLNGGNGLPFQTRSTDTLEDLASICWIRL